MNELINIIFGKLTVLLLHWRSILQLYHPENIYLVLVGMEVWTSADLINVDMNDKSNTLAEFCDYRKNNINPYHNNDNAQLIT